ncbi:prenyltransferase, partial [Streptomyces rubellomurinus subsp. indigoferus]
GPVAAGPRVVYPHGKRFTDCAQAFLGIAQAMGPVGAWRAATGRWSWDAAVLGGAVGIWIGSFDLIYASQNVESDRENTARSIPARFGVPSAIRGAWACHVATTLLLRWFAVL